MCRQIHDSRCARGHALDGSVPATIHSGWKPAAAAGVAGHHPAGEGVPPGGDARSAGRAYAVIAGAGPAAGCRGWRITRRISASRRLHRRIRHGKNLRNAVNLRIDGAGRSCWRGDWCLCDGRGQRDGADGLRAGRGRRRPGGRRLAAGIRAARIGRHGQRGSWRTDPDPTGSGAHEPRWANGRLWRRHNRVRAGWTEPAAQDHAIPRPLKLRLLHIFNPVRYCAISHVRT
jgi:hypothetical protein